MDPLHSVLLTVGLFALTFLSPGPNLLVVVHASLTAGRRAGIATGLGVATGDAIYAALGLFGMATLIAEGGAVFNAVKIVGGVYLLAYGLRMLAARRSARSSDMAQPKHVAPTAGRQFMRGLLTDLANPQTVLFFASIFAVTLAPSTPGWAKLASLCGIAAV